MGDSDQSLKLVSSNKPQLLLTNQIKTKQFKSNGGKILLMSWYDGFDISPILQAFIHFYRLQLWFCSQGGGIPACIAGFQAHTQGGNLGVWPGGWVSRPTLGGGEVSRPTSERVPAPGGLLRGGGLETAASGTHPTGMHSCCLHDYEDMLITLITNLTELNGHPIGINLEADDFALGLYGLIIGCIMVITLLLIINKPFVSKNMCHDA